MTTLEGLKNLLHRTTVLDEAKELVYNGDRQKQYGHPREHFARTIGMFNALFASKLKEPLVPEDWAKIMILDKLARSVHIYKHDHPLDVIGYGATWVRVAEKDEP